MEIINRDRNVFNYNYAIACFYNTNCRLDVLIYGIWSIGYLEAKFF